MGIRSYFKGGRLARMSDGSYCVIRDLGLVKGGNGLRCHETLLPLSLKGAVLKVIEVLRRKFGRPRHRQPAEGPAVRLAVPKHAVARRRT